MSSDVVVFFESLYAITSDYFYMLTHCVAKATTTC